MAVLQAWHCSYPAAYGIEAEPLLRSGMIQASEVGTSSVQLSSEGVLPTIAPAAQSAAPQTTTQAPPVASDRVEHRPAPLPE